MVQLVTMHSAMVEPQFTLFLKVHDAVSALIVAQLLFLEAEETHKPIHLYVNSPGGSVTAGMAIYDTVSCYALPPTCEESYFLLDAGEYRLLNKKWRGVTQPRWTSTYPRRFTLTALDKPARWVV